MPDSLPTEPVRSWEQVHTRWWLAPFDVALEVVLGASGLSDERSFAVEVSATDLRVIESDQPDRVYLWDSIRSIESPAEGGLARINRTDGTSVVLGDDHLPGNDRGADSALRTERLGLLRRALEASRQDPRPR
jgi:hypothetical protein